MLQGSKRCTEPTINTSYVPSTYPTHAHTHTWTRTQMIILTMIDELRLLSLMGAEARALQGIKRCRGSQVQTLRIFYLRSLQLLHVALIRPQSA